MLETVKARLRPIASQINLPTVIKTTTLPNDHVERLFIATQVGEILYTGTNGLETFLDIRSRIIQLGMNGGYDERGLLGLAFHPDFTNNGLFYVHYSMAGTQGPGALPHSFMANPCLPQSFNLQWENRDRNFDHIDTVEEWIINGTIPQKRRTLLNLRRPFFNHNGVNSLNFSPETGHLVLTTGDGGSGYDPFNLAQNDLEIAGKIIEIDLQRLPFDPSPPVVTRFDELPPATREALFVTVKGVRNISGISYQRMNNRWIKYIGQVGQNLVESIYSYDQSTMLSVREIIQNPHSTSSLINLGWRGWEGDLPTFNIQPCNNQPSRTQKMVTFYEDVLNMVTQRISPLAAYYHDDPRPNHFSGTAITGVKAYLGLQIPALTGKIIFTDFARKLTRTPVRGILGYTEPLKRNTQNKVGIIDIGNPFGTQAAYYTTLGTNRNQTRLFLGTYSTLNVTAFHQGQIYEVIQNE